MVESFRPSRHWRARSGALALTLTLCTLATRGVAAAEPSAAATTDDSVLDHDRRNLQGNQVSIDGFGGSLIGGSIGHSYIAGARVTYFPIRHLGIGAAYGNSRVFAARGLGTLDDRAVHYITGRVELPLVSALRLGRRRPLQMDLFGEAGAGAVHVADRWQALGAVGGGVRIYPRISWLAITVNVLTLLHRTRQEQSTVFDGDVAFTVGIAIILPRRAGRVTERRARAARSDLTRLTARGRTPNTTACTRRC